MEIILGSHMELLGLYTLQAHQIIFGTQAPTLVKFLHSYLVEIIVETLYGLRQQMVELNAHKNYHHLLIRG